MVFVSNTDVFFLQYRLPVAQAERDRGAEVVVIAPDGGRGHEVERAGFEFIPLPLSRRGLNPWAELKTVLFLARTYRRLRPDLVHHLTIKPVLYGSLAARFCLPRPAVVNAVTGLGFVFTEAGASLLRPLVRLLYRGVLRGPRTVTIFENGDDRREFVAAGLIPRSSAALLPGLGVDCGRYHPTAEPEGTPLVILPCRMLWNKGVGHFVDAATLLRSRGIEARFALVGSPDPGNPSCIPAAQLEQWEAEGNVEWWKHRSDMPAVFASANLVAFPTCYREGVPRVLLEAAAAGRAIVASDMPGCREVVRPGVNGELVPPGDVHALASAIETLLKDAPRRAAYGRAARGIAVSEFDADTVIGRMLALHEEVVHSGGEQPTGGSAVPSEIPARLAPASVGERKGP
ncbi:MAG: glycosyltransferase family 4 protein [Gemmatimonadetes bacterium]|nr:glycosyltransferase family 4 protein [Gemmatimonadota bacterium]